MLLSLKITNFALISKSEIDFTEGFTVITGESGAGKSILMSALMLVLGAKADVSSIKQGENKCQVEAEFSLEGKYKEEFENLDLDWQENTILRREIAQSGKSRAFVNDTPVNINTLKEISSLLVDVHSQRETVEIFTEDFQIDFLDNVANNKKELEDYTSKYLSYNQTLSQINNYKNQADKDQKELEFLTFQYNEIAGAKLQEGEQTELEEELEALNHNEDIKNALSVSCNLLEYQDSNSINQSLKEVSHSLSKIKDYFPKVAEIANRLEETRIEIADLSRDLIKIDENIEFSTERLDFVNQRLNQIFSLEKKYACLNLEELIEKQNSLKTRLDNITNSGANLEELEAKLKKEKEELTISAKNLSLSRQKVVKTISNEVKELLINLSIKNAEFDINIDFKEDFMAKGCDKVTFLFSANKNFAMQDISKAASGGEISRLMLALKYMLSRTVKLPAMIFDEIDTGISGDAAGKTASMFVKMSKTMQVICITHLPQVAAKANTHLKVYKSNQGEQTTTQVKVLNQDERVEEIAIMLSGETVSEFAIQNAKDLLKNS